MKVNYLFPLLSILILTNGLYIPQSLPSYSTSGIVRFIQQVISLEGFKAENSIVRTDLEDWIEQQKNISFDGILNNIGGISETLSEMEVARGAVIASPSKTKPNYYYQWTRDSALTIKTLIFHLDDLKFEDSKVASIIESYIENNYYIQRLDNESGKFNDSDKGGLGEPKYMPNNDPFDEPWGRPQRDGPGLRIITILGYLDLLEKYNKSLTSEFLKSPEFIYHKIIRHDLVYIVRNWFKEGFDIWEEIHSYHLFTSLTQLRAIKDGLVYARKYEKDSKFIEELESTFKNLKTFIEVDSGYKSNALPYLIESPKLLRAGIRSGLDAAILLASLHSHNMEYGDYSDIPFDINNNYLINTLSAMVTDMKYRYPINHNKIGFEKGIGVALGRYPEDIYDGYGYSEGNPWFISTASASEIVYKLIYTLKESKQDLVINKFNEEFFKQFIDFEINENFKEIVIPYNSIKFRSLLNNLLRYSDSFLDIIMDHVDNDGHMSEQFNKYHGFMQGAKDLTWSYSAVWNSFRWREKTLKLLYDN